MAEIHIKADQKQLTTRELLPQSEEERFKTFDDLLDTLSRLYQRKYEVPEADISKILTDFHASGASEPLQINTWWTPTENWSMEKMLEVGSLQIALAIHQLNLPKNMMVTSTIEQKGVDPKLNKTIFVMGFKDDQGNVCITQEKPVLDKLGQQIITENKPRYEPVEVEYTPENVNSLISSLTVTN